MSQPDPMALELRAMRDQMKDLIEEQRYIARRLLAADDRRMGMRLLPAGARLAGDRDFTGPGLAAVAQRDRSEAGLVVLGVLAELGDTDIGGLRTFGWLLSRLEGKPLAGYRLKDAGGHSEGRRYRIERVPRG